MADLNSVQAKALRIRAAVDSLTDPDDVAILHEYLAELEFQAALHEVEDARRGGVLH